MKKNNTPRRLFFYASRQLWRRRRTYLAVFAVSVVLLALVMAALELFESYHLQSLEIASAGTHHAAIYDQPNDWSEEIMKDGGVTSVTVIPHNARLASSVDATAPGKVTVENERIDAILGVRYLWGSPPGEGEIAVPLSLYREEGWLEAGEVNDLYFKATDMTYEPLRLSGIFTVSNIGADYVFVTEKTARRIDKATGAHEKVDLYLTFRHVSDRYAAHVLHRLWRKIPFIETDAQARLEIDNEHASLRTRYEEYLNLEFLNNQRRYTAAPHLLWMLPVIAAAALVLAAFMIAWTRSHAPELGILGSMGADKRDLCAIPAGQILLITFAASPPVVLLSACLSRIYLKTYNEVLTGVGFRFAVPWGKLAGAAVLFVSLSTLFTYLGIARLAEEPPFPLISGSFRSKMPFVRASSRFLSKMRDRVASFALLQSIRELRQEILNVAVSALIPTILGAVLLLLLVYRSSMSAALFHIGAEPAADCVVSSLSEIDENVPDPLPLTEEIRGEILSMDGVERCLPFSWFGYSNAKYRYQGGWIISNEPQVRLGEDGMWERVPFCVGNEETASMLVSSVLEGDPDEVFRDPGAMIYVRGKDAGSHPDYRVGDLLDAAPETHASADNGIIAAPKEFFQLRVCAVVTLKRDPKVLEDNVSCFLLSRAGGEAFGLSPADEYQKLYIDYRADMDEEAHLDCADAIQNAFFLLRYHVQNLRTPSRLEAAEIRVTTEMFLILASMVLLAFAVTTMLASRMKTSRLQRDFAVIRQLGADDGDVMKTMRTGVYLNAAVAFGASLCVLLAAAIVYTIHNSWQLGIEISSHRDTYTPEAILYERRRILEAAAYILAVFPLSLPFHALTCLASLAGTIPPTARLLHESIAEGLRKDTD